MSKCSKKCKNECFSKNNISNNQINNKRNTIPLRYVYRIIFISLFIFILCLVFGVYYFCFHRNGWIKKNAELINEKECEFNKYKKCDYEIKIVIDGIEYKKKFHSNKEIKITEIDGKNTIEIEYDPKNPNKHIELYINKDIAKLILAVSLIITAVFTLYFFIYKYFKIIKGINKIKLDHDFFM